MNYIKERLIVGVILAIILSIVFLFTGCKKNTCWECTVRRMNGTTYTDRVCNDGSTPQFKDSNGNDLNSVCQKK